MVSEANEQTEVQSEPAEEEKDPNALPDWVDMPEGMRPPPGVRVCFMRFRASWTSTPDKGERQCILWELTDNDERVALVRCRDNPANASNELAKQMIRAIDGVRVNWGAKHGEPGNLDEFWREIGPKCRSAVTRHYQRTHAMSVAETADFLENCVAVRTAR